MRSGGRRWRRGTWRHRARRHPSQSPGAFPPRSGLGPAEGSGPAGPRRPPRPATSRLRRDRHRWPVRTIGPVLRAHRPDRPGARPARTRNPATSRPSSHHVVLPHDSSPVNSAPKASAVSCWSRELPAVAASSSSKSRPCTAAIRTVRRRSPPSSSSPPADVRELPFSWSPAPCIADDCGHGHDSRADMFTEDGKPSADDPREHGPTLGDERTTLVESLRCQRLTLEMKCSGLDAEAMARRSVEPSTMLAPRARCAHLAEMERATFGSRRWRDKDAPRLASIRHRPRRPSSTAPVPTPRPSWS